LFRVAEKQHDFRVAALCQPLKPRQMPLVHRHQVIKILKISARYLPGITDVIMGDVVLSQHP
jgi:hypothetical protein